MPKQSPMFSPSNMPQQRPEHPFVPPDRPEKPQPAPVQAPETVEPVEPAAAIGASNEVATEKQARPTVRYVGGPAIEKAIRQALGGDPNHTPMPRKRGRRFAGHRGPGASADMSAPLPPDDPEA